VKFDGVDGVVLLDQLRAIDTMQRTPSAGRVDQKVLNKALGTLRAMFAE
jgi:mRNA-degrading endonuclease toxin of MazEF toxin-antitoxin module